MRRWLMTVIGLVFLIGAFSVMPTASAAEDPCLFGRSCSEPQPEVTGGGYTYSYDGDGNVVRTKNQQGSSSDGTPLEFRYVPTCAHNRAPDADGSVDDAMCTGAFMGCDDGEIRMRVYSRPVGSRGSWEYRGVQCMGADDTIPRADIEAAAREQLERLVSDPTFQIQPTTRTLVQLPTIVHLTDDGRQVRDPVCGADAVCFEVRTPVPGRLEAHPQYVWEFCLGGQASCAPADGEGPGRAYDGTSPRENPGHYVSYAYHETGQGSVVLRLVWKATFTVAGLPPITLDDLPRESRQPIQVVEARSQLVASY